MSLLPVQDAQSRLLGMTVPLALRDAPVEHAAGRWTTRDILSRRSQPAIDLSAMDGYAIRFSDMPGPWRIIGESAAGAAFTGRIQSGEAVRIYTGAGMAEGADTVIMQEDVMREGDNLVLTGDGPGARGRHVRTAGSDFRSDQCIIPAGTRLAASHVALAALAGYGALALPRLPRIALVSTGSELVNPGEPARVDQIPSSNAVMLRAMLGAWPCDVTGMGIIPDTLDALTGCFAALRDYDIVVSTGGASVGDHDLVKPALEGAGGVIDFWKIRMRPGKPLISGTLGNAIFLGLPGNPVSAFVTAHLFLMPLVRGMTGCPAPLPGVAEARLSQSMPPTGERDDYVRAQHANGLVAPVAHQDSAAILDLSRANCLIRRQALSPAVQAGEAVEILPI